MNLKVRSLVLLLLLGYAILGVPHARSAEDALVDNRSLGIADSLVVNQSMEAADDKETDRTLGWTPWGKGEFRWSADAVEGKRALELSRTEWDTGWYSTEFKVDGSYKTIYPWHTLTAQVRRKDSVGRVYVQIAWYDGNAWKGSSSSEWLPGGTHDWETVKVTALPPYGATRGQIFLRADAETGIVGFDDVSLKVEGQSVKTPPGAHAQEYPFSAPMEAFANDYADQDELWTNGFYTVAHSLWVLGKHDQALEQVMRSFTPGDEGAEHRALLRAAEWRLERGRHELAFRLVEDLLKRKLSETDEFRARALHLRIVAEYHIWTTAEIAGPALDEIEKKLLARFPKRRNEILVHLGFARLWNNLYPEAVRSLEEALSLIEKDGEVSPLLLEARLWLGITYGYRYQFPKSISLLSGVVKEHTVVPQARRALFYLYYHLGTEGDVKARRESIKKLADWAQVSLPEKGYDEERAMGHFHLGETYHPEEETADARREFEIVIERYPGTTWVRYAREELKKPAFNAPP